jgi:hypothetical protein
MTVDETLARLKALYFAATPATIDAAFDEAIDLLKALPSDDERAHAAVYMEGLVEMRQEFKGGRGTSKRSQNTARRRAEAAPKPRK